MEKYDVIFKKKFGQNFLNNNDIVEKIVKVSEVDSNSLVIEVGPGGAIMTRELAMIAKNVLAYEIDSDLADELYSRISDLNNVDVLFQDFLESNIANDIMKYSFEKLFFVSNVPYYITTPIIIKLIKSKLNFNKIVMMVQKEVGDRFSESPGSRNYGSITVLLNYYYNIKKEFYVSRNNFIPRPNVDSVVISFTEKKKKLPVLNIDFFEQVVRDSFQFKRKTIRNNLKKYDLDIVEKVLNKYGFDLNVRSECLAVEVFVDLSNELYR